MELRCSRSHGKNACGKQTIPGSKWCDSHQIQHREGQRRRRKSEAYRFYTRLLEDGVPKREARLFAGTFAMDHMCCYYCGMSAWWIKRIRAEGRYMPGPEAWRYGLSLDHLIPGIRGDIRLIVLADAWCNHFRSKGRRTTEEILEAARKRWTWLFKDNEIKWLRSAPVDETYRMRPDT